MSTPVRAARPPTPRAAFVARVVTAGAALVVLSFGLFVAHASPSPDAIAVEQARLALVATQSRMGATSTPLPEEARLTRVQELTDELVEAPPAVRLAAQVRSIVARPELRGSARFDWPVAGPVTAGFGPRLRPPDASPFHDGIDILAPPGSPTTAPKEGRVAVVTVDRHMGRVVMVDHGVDPDGRTVLTVYAHLQRVLVRAGEAVRAGDQLGTVGSSGSAAFGPHLHFEIRVGGQPVDPRAWLTPRQ